MMLWLWIPPLIARGNPFPMKLSSVTTGFYVRVRGSRLNGFSVRVRGSVTTGLVSVGPLLTDEVFFQGDIL